MPLGFQPPLLAPSMELITAPKTGAKIRKGRQAGHFKIAFFHDFLKVNPCRIIVLSLPRRSFTSKSVIVFAPMTH
jgi:hypothetical protein